MRIKLIKRNHYNWQGYQLKAGNITLGITPEIGGRIISLKYCNDELFFVNPDITGETYNFKKVEDLTAEKRNLGFRLWGGDKTWVAPESKWTERIPPLELDAGRYQSKIDGNSILMVSPKCRETGIQIKRRVKLFSDGTILLDQNFLNISDRSIRVAIWDVTQMVRPFSIYLPTNKNEVHLDNRFPASKKYFTQLVSAADNWVRIDCEKLLQYKYGARIQHGKALAIRYDSNRVLAMFRLFDIYHSDEYVNDNMVEIYNSGDFNYFEFEVMSPLKTLKPGEEFSHRQYWILHQFELSVELSDIIEFFNNKSI